MSSHSRALQMTCELGTSRSALTVKCPPKQLVLQLHHRRADGTHSGHMSARSRVNQQEESRTELAGQREQIEKTAGRETSRASSPTTANCGSDPIRQ